MTDFNLIIYMQEELRRTPTAFRRYMYDRILWDDRMIGLVGPRGVGKSTMESSIYPFYNQPGYGIRLQQVMTQTLEVDIPQYAGMNVSTSRKLARLLAILSSMLLISLIWEISPLS